MKKRVLLALLIVAVAVGVTVALTRGDKAGKEPTGRAGAAVTEADKGGEVTVPLQEPFVLDLKGSPDAPWGLPASQADTLALVGSSQELDGSVKATFLPLEVTPGVVVSAQRGGTSTERFEVTIRVQA